MTEFRIEVRVTPRAGLLDPQGKAVHSALQALEFKDVADVRIGRLLRVNVHAASADEARSRVETMCQQLLANPVTEDYEISISEHENMRT